MHYAFQDKENLFMIMDYLSGGDLRYHMIEQRKFSEDQCSKILNPFLIFIKIHYQFDPYKLVLAIKIQI